MQERGVKYTSIRGIIKGLYKCKLIHKLDLAKGFRHMCTAPSTWRYKCMFFRIKHPFTGEILAFSVCDAHISMGLKLSPAWFEDVIQSVTKGILFHRPDLFFSKENEILLYSYLDDFMIGAGTRHGSLTDAMAHSLQQQAYLRGIASFLGLTFKTSKFEVPCEWQKLLGLTLNTALQTVALKDGKALKVVNLIDKVLQSKKWELLLLQKVAGNTIWLSMILPRIQSYATPLIDLITMINKVEEKQVLRYRSVGLDQEAVRSLKFLRSIFAHDPKVHINTFLNLKGGSRFKFWSDASGYDSPLTPTKARQKNPTPGFCASFFHHKIAPINCCFIKATAWPEIKRAIVRSGYTGRG